MGETRYVPATGGTQVQWLLAQHHDTARLPFVDVSVVFSEHPGDEDHEPYVSLGAYSDYPTVHLTVSELRQLVSHLQRAITEIEGNDGTAS